MLKLIDQINIREKKVFIRVDFNVKIKDGQILDDARIRATLPTIQYALDQKAKVILASHLGRPKGVFDSKRSLLPVAQKLTELLNVEVIFPEDCIGDSVKKLATDLREGKLILLENLRFHPEEEKNDPSFSEKLAALADIYISDSFGSAHRKHASTYGMVDFFKEKGIGFLMKKELDFLGTLLNNPQRPFIAILGGAKVSDKIGVIENLLNHVDELLIGGGMAYTFLKAKGMNVGKSLVEEAKVHQAEKILARAEIKGIKLLLPIDSQLAEKFEEGTPYQLLNVKDDWDQKMALDIGPQTVELFAGEFKNAKTIFWNGPMGAFEISPFHEGTFELARRLSKIKAVTVVGGGDSLAAIRQAGLQNEFTHLSTGGGASIEFLEGALLPGLKVLYQTS